MEKVVIAAWREPGADPEPVAESLRAVGSSLASAGRWVTVATEDERGSEMLVPGVSDPPVLTGMVTAWVDTLEEHADLPAVEAPRTAAYLVTESVPLSYQDRGWEDGASTPGISLVSAIRRRAGLDDEQFYDGWHGSHAVLTLRVHPVTRYVRNAVVRPLTPGAPTVDGFVQNQFADVEDLLRPERMYGAAAPEIPWEEGMRRVAEDIATFLDMDAVAATPMTETILRSTPWERGPARPVPIDVPTPGAGG